jgi:AcrR family transcriptional regulator
MPRRTTRPTDSGDVRTHLLDTADALYRREGASGLNMREVAAEAGVARSTLYRYFRKRDALLLAMVQREIDATAAIVRTGLEGVRGAEDLIVEGMRLALRDLPKRRILMDLLVSDDFPLRRGRVWRSESMVRLGHGFMHDVLARARAEGRLRRGVRAALLEEWVYRTLLSLLTLPSPWIKDDAQLRRALRKLLIPVVLEPRSR